MAVTAKFITDLSYENFPLTGPIVANFTDKSTSTGDPITGWFWTVSNATTTNYYTTQNLGPITIYPTALPLTIELKVWAGADLGETTSMTSDSTMGSSRDGSSGTSNVDAYSNWLADSWSSAGTASVRWYLFKTGPGQLTWAFEAVKRNYDVDLTNFTGISWTEISFTTYISGGVKSSLGNSIIADSGTHILNDLSDYRESTISFTVDDLNGYPHMPGDNDGYRVANVQLKAHSYSDLDTRSITIASGGFIDNDNNPGVIYNGVGFIGDPLIGFTPLGVTFTDTSISIDAMYWEWDFGHGGAGSTFQNPSTIYQTNTS
jgi:hypothetical protein